MGIVGYVIAAFVCIWFVVGMVACVWAGFMDTDA